MSKLLESSWSDMKEMFRKKQCGCLQEVELTPRNATHLRGGALSFLSHMSALILARLHISVNPQRVSKPISHAAHGVQWDKMFSPGPLSFTEQPGPPCRALSI